MGSNGLWGGVRSPTQRKSQETATLTWKVAYVEKGREPESLVSGVMAILLGVERREDLEYDQMKKRGG